MNDNTNTSNAASTANAAKPTESHDLVDLLLAQLAAKVEQIETKTKSEASLRDIPPDVPRFVTRW